MALYLTKACLSLKRGSILHLYPNLQQEPWRKFKGTNPHFNSTNNRPHIVRCSAGVSSIILLHHIFCSLQRQSLQVKSDSRQLLSQRHHRLWYSLELWGPSPPLRHLQTPHVERIESSLPTPCSLLSRWYKHLYNMSICESGNNGPDYPDPHFTEMKGVFEMK